MNYRNLDHWDIDKLTPGFVFLVQRIDELLFDYTIDTYKPMALNAPSLCVEALNTIDEIKNGTIDKHHILHVLEELRVVLNKDFIAKSLLNASVEYYTGYSEENTLLDDLKLRLQLLERSLERYRYLEKIKEALITSVNSNEKDNIDFLVKNMITAFINWGVSKQYLYREFNKFFFNKEKTINNIEQMKEFLSIITPKIHYFTIYFCISKNIQFLSDSYKFFNITEVDEKSPESSETMVLYGKNQLNQKHKSIIIKIEDIKSPDPYIARDVAERRLESLSNTSELYFHNSKLKWVTKALVIQSCCKEEKIIVTRSINPMLKALNYGANDVASKTNWIFKNINLKGESFQKFNRAIELHSNSLHNLKTESQLVNLWTVFETIIPSNSNKSKVENISDSILPIIQRNYFNKLIYTLYKNCERWDKQKFENLLTSLNLSEVDKLKNFVIFLSDSGLQNKRDEFYKELGHFHLLRNRIYKLSEILSDKEKILKEIERHKRNVAWQVRRIYRTRNLIVHSGKNSIYISTLIENAHDYIDQILNEIIYLATSNYRVFTIEQAFGLSKLLSDELEEVIKNSTDYKCFLDKIITNVGIR